MRIGQLPGREDPCREVEKNCRRSMRGFNEGVVTREEARSSIFDHLVHAGTAIHLDCVRHCIRALPMAWVNDVLAYANRHTEPRLFHPLPTSEEKRSEAAAKALAAQEIIVSAAKDKIRFHAMDFFFEEEMVGHFEETCVPTEEGSYPYMPYLGPGHLEMQKRLRAAGRAECWYLVEGGKITFTVFGCSERRVLELGGFKRSDN